MNELTCTDCVEEKGIINADKAHFVYQGRSLCLEHFTIRELEASDKPIDLSQ